MDFPFRIILGSKSPRRKELLAALNISFTQKTKDTDESFSKDLPVEDVAAFLAQKKAEALASELQVNELLICSDTTVVLDGLILNKAANAEEAKRMLEALSGKKHEVITGVCLKSLEKEQVFSVSTLVYFKNLSEKEIDFYINEYQPFDKAGAYGIQEWIGMIGVEKIEGDFYNVMGLPLEKLYEALKAF